MLLQSQHQENLRKEQAQAQHCYSLRHNHCQLAITHTAISRGMTVDNHYNVIR